MHDISKREILSFLSVACEQLCLRAKQDQAQREGRTDCNIPTPTLKLCNVSKTAYKANIL